MTALRVNCPEDMTREMDKEASSGMKCCARRILIINYSISNTAHPAPFSGL
jgi:hypothetical protein